MDRLITYGTRSRILAIETGNREKEIIRQVSDTLGFDCAFARDSAEALGNMQRRYYNMIIVDPQLIFGNAVNFIGNIRAIRGYERTPVLVVTNELHPEKAAAFLDDGADGYLQKPLSEELLFSHINLFLRRQILQRFQENEYLRRDLNLEKGQILLCSTSREILDIPVNDLNTEVVVVLSEDELFRELYSRTIWLLLIGVKATWAQPFVGKIKNEEAFNVQIILLRNTNVLDSEVVNFFNQGGDDITSVNKPTFILSRQINSRIEREFYYKEKYINALTTAASKLPIRSQSRLSLQSGNWSLEAFHRSHEDVPGGDFYETLLLPDGNRVFLVGDVMGKKWGAWFFSLAYLGYIRSAVRNLSYKGFEDPAQLLNELNSSIFRDFRLSEVFTTLTVILMQKGNGTISLASAGGLPVLIQHHADGTIESVQPKGTLLGLVEEEQYKSSWRELQPGDRILLFTDGYVERQGKERMQGIQSLALCFEQYATESNLEKLDRVIREVSDSPFDDDRTLVSIRYTGSGDH